MLLPDLVIACPTCGARCDAHDRTDGPDVLPKPGDVSICGHCIGLLIWTERDGRLAVREPSLEERGVYLGDLRVLEAMASLLTAPSIADGVLKARRLHATRS